MKKDDLIKAMKNGWPNRENMLNSIFRSINTALIKKESVTVYNFGKFDVVRSTVREGHDFKTGKRIQITPKLKIRFTPSPKILEILNARNIPEGP